MINMSDPEKTSANQNFMGASTRQGNEIAVRSRKIVKKLIGNKINHLRPEEISIIERIVHSTADPEYADITQISREFINKSLNSIRNDEDILTDISMVKVGINKYNGHIKCYINHQKTIELAKKEGITRAAAAIQVAADESFEGLVVIGNSPTALLKVIELYNKNQINVKAVIGVPVGFVAASESKEALEKSGIPCLVTRGPKGGTPVAVAAINSLINQI